MPSIRKILVPTDFSPAALNAARFAQELAASFHAKLLLLHVVPEASYPMLNAVEMRHFPNLKAELHRQCETGLEELANQLGNPPGLEMEVRDGSPHAEILETVRKQGIDMIVMGTHGHTGIKHAVLGSTAERVVRLAQCPVVTLHSPTR